MYIYLLFAHRNSLWRKSSQTYSILSLSLFAFAMDKRKKTGGSLLVNAYLVKEFHSSAFIECLGEIYYSLDDKVS